MWKQRVEQRMRKNRSIITHERETENERGETNVRRMKSHVREQKQKEKARMKKMNDDQ